MKLVCGFRLEILDPKTNRPIRCVTSMKSVTDAGYEFLIRAVGDPATRPPVVNTIGIGWGAGSTTPFDRSQTALQGAYTSLKAATWSYDPLTDLMYATLEATWGVNDPATELILIGEVGLFNGAGTMVDRTPVTPTPKKPDEPMRVHGVIGYTESETGFTLI